MAKVFLPPNVVVAVGCRRKETGLLLLSTRRAELGADWLNGDFRTVAFRWVGDSSPEEGK